MTTAPRRRLRPEVRRALIIDAATGLLSRRGFWALTMAEVAKEVGVTVQAISHYFPSKDDLVMAVLEYRDAVDIRHVAPEGTVIRTAQGFSDTIGRLVARNAERPGLIQLYTILSAEALDEQHPAHEFFSRRFERGVSTVAKMAELWHPEPVSLAIQVHSVLDGLQLSWLRDRRLDLVAEWQLWAREYLGVREPTASLTAL